jgi:hypothetical protein
MGTKREVRIRLDAYMPHDELEMLDESLIEEAADLLVLTLEKAGFSCQIYETVIQEI